MKDVEEKLKYIFLNDKVEFYKILIEIEKRREEG